MIHEIAKLKKLENVGHMDENLLEMGRELSELRDRESTMRTKLQVENTWLRGMFQEMERKLYTIENFSLEALQFRLPSKSYELYLKAQWM